MTRKEFLALLALGSASQALGETPPATPVPAAATGTKKPAPPLKLPPVQPGPTYLLAGPMVGHVGPREARLWVRATARATWAVRIAASPSLEGAREIAGAELTDETACTGSVLIDGLNPATRYYYEVVVAGRGQTAAPLPSFVTAAEHGSRGRLRIAFGSCVGVDLIGGAPTWAELAARRPSPPETGGFDLLLMLGDNHYADSTNLEKLRTYYTAHRLSPGWRELSANTPIYAIWDDHDYGPNNSDGTSVGKADALRAFREFWANPACGEPENPGCYFTVQHGAVQIFMLDGRYHRSPNKAPDEAGKTMFGAAQIAWLKRELLASKAAIKILANGSEWQSHGSDDSYSLFRHERDALLTWIGEQKIEGVMLLSGDRHFSSGYHVLGRFVELSSGPFGSGNAKLRPNKERFTGHDDGKLWFVLDIDTTQAETAVAYELWQTTGGLLERRALTWAQLHGREPIPPSVLPLRGVRFEAKPTPPKPVPKIAEPA